MDAGLVKGAETASRRMTWCCDSGRQHHSTKYLGTRHCRSLTISLRGWLKRKKSIQERQKFPLTYQWVDHIVLCIVYRD